MSALLLRHAGQKPGQTCRLRKKSSMSSPAMKGRDMPLLVPGIGWKNIGQNCEKLCPAALLHFLLNCSMRAALGIADTPINSASRC